MTIPSVTRREFLKVCGGLMAAAVAAPVAVFVAPRRPFVQHAPSLYGLYSHLGILPVSQELNICEGRLLDIGDWDGTGYPCLIENACTFGPEKPRAWIYDFDLWNFRHDDALIEAIGREAFRDKRMEYNSHSHWYAHRRFGADLARVAECGNGRIWNRELCKAVR